MINKRTALFATKRVQKTKKQKIAGVAKGIGKGMLKGAKFTALGAAGIGMVGLQAAVSVASNGRYSFKEGVGAFAATVGAANVGLNKISKKASNLNKEYKQIKYGKESIAEKQREKDFWNNEKNLNRYQDIYGEMGVGKLSNELRRASEIAKGGTENFEEQLQVMAFSDHLTDQRFNAEWDKSKFENEQERTEQMKQRADEIRANGTKDLKTMTDEDVIKSDIREKSGYDKLAQQTLFVKKEIPKEIRKGTKKERDNFIRNEYR